MLALDKKFLSTISTPLVKECPKKEGEIFFVPKTLPGELVEVEIEFSKKGMNWCRSIAILKASKDRITSDCPHFEECGGCQYWHTPYPIELSTKATVLYRLFKQMNVIPCIHRAPNRKFYRNRIQLHYDLQKEKLGLFGASKTEKKILSVPNCLLPVKEISSELKKSYDQQQWKSLVANGPPEGHIEFQKKDHQVTKVFNSVYSHGGFSQVYEKAFHELLLFFTEEVSPYLKESIGQINEVIELFSGQGDLGAALLPEKSFLYDLGPISRALANSETFTQTNLFQKSPKELYSPKSSNQKNKVLLLDPPRSGFTRLAEWVAWSKADAIVYVSCRPQTLLRDLKTLPPHWKITQLHLWDFFPGTFHFESVAICLPKTL